MTRRAEAVAVQTASWRCHPEFALLGAVILMVIAGS